MADRRVDIEDGVVRRLGVRSGDEWTYAAERPLPGSDAK
jgi:hypothetical protein